ncbi:hypothetical protein ACFVUS_12470 [Nocardia sp. NPDC058058]|uniref:hypothetical protein n=1 Tax=Nocardia sp. NPDC058058 TaxID=3346317 RepID=UPI0036DBC99F
MFAFLKSAWSNEPLRATSYTITGLVLTYLVATGHLDTLTSNLVGTIAGLILVGGATEVARTQVKPVSKG